MNNEEEMLVRQSKWSGRRVVLLYWFAIVFIGTSTAAGLGTSILKPTYKIEADDHDGITAPWGPDDCIACHPDEVAGWNTTWHAQIVGFYDPNDPTMNGSKVSFNGTHYWRTPNTPANASDLTNQSNIQYWTYNQLFNASGQQCCMNTRWYNVTLINATTGELLAFNATLSGELGGYTSNIWEIGVSCAACHANPGEFSLSYTVCSGCHLPGGRQHVYYMQSKHYSSLADLLASGDTYTLLYGNWFYVGQSTYMQIGDLDPSEYYRITCVTCHDPHDATVNTGDVSHAMSPWTNPYTGEKFGPGGSQLRAATVNDLCGICHDTRLNTSTGYFIDPSNHTTLSCTDCHGYVYTPASSSFSTLQHSWKFSGGEPGEVCGLCHGDDNGTVYTLMQYYQQLYGNPTEMKASYDTKLAAAQAAYDLANSTAGADTAKLANAWALIQEAKQLEAKVNTLLFHNPDVWSLALTKLDAALIEATEALPEETTPTTTTPTTTTPPTTTPPTTTPTTTTTPAIGLIAIMTILSVVILFRRKKR